VSEKSGSTPFVILLSLARRHTQAITMPTVTTYFNTADILFIETYCIKHAGQQNVEKTTAKNNQQLFISAAKDLRGPIVKIHNINSAGSQSTRTCSGKLSFKSRNS